MNTQLQQKIEEARETYIGRIFTFGGSVLFLIGSFLAVTTAYMRIIVYYIHQHKKRREIPAFFYANILNTPIAFKNTIITVTGIT